MQAREIMTRDVVTVRPDATIREAARTMDDLNVGALPVCEGRRLIGIVTDRDITVRATADSMLPETTLVRAVMTEDVRWCFEDDPVEAIESAMARHKIRRTPVVDHSGRLVGMIALGDLATDRAPGTEEALRSISEPSQRRRPAPTTDYRDAPWPPYGSGPRPRD
jgi:CBS domain-containing protein